MEKLNDQDSVIRLIGRNTALKFEYLVDGVATYRTVVGKTIDGNYVDMQIDVFYEPLGDLLNFCTVGFLTFKRQVFELKIIHPTPNSTETLYHKKYIDKNENRTGTN